MGLLYCFESRRRFDNIVAFSVEKNAEQIPLVIIVFDDKNSLWGGHAALLRMNGACRILLRFGS